MQAQSMSSYHGEQTIKKTKKKKSSRKFAPPDRRSDSCLDQYFESLGALAWLLQCTAVPKTRHLQALVSIITGGPPLLDPWHPNAHNSRRLQFLSRVAAACGMCALATAPTSLDGVVWSRQWLRAVLPSALGTHKTRVPSSTSGFAWEYLVKWCGDGAEDAKTLGLARKDVGLARTFVNRPRELDQCCRDAILTFIVTNVDDSAGMSTDKKLNYRILRVPVPSQTHYVHTYILPVVSDVCGALLYAR